MRLLIVVALLLAGCTTIEVERDLCGYKWVRDGAARRAAKAVRDLVQALAVANQSIVVSKNGMSVHLPDRGRSNGETIRVENHSSSLQVSATQFLRTSHAIAPKAFTVFEWDSNR